MHSKARSEAAVEIRIRITLSPFAPTVGARCAVHSILTLQAFPVQGRCQTVVNSPPPLTWQPVAKVPLDEAEDRLTEDG